MVDPCSKCKHYCLVPEVPCWEKFQYMERQNIKEQKELIMQSIESIEKQLKLLKNELKRAKGNNEHFTVLDLQARIRALDWVLGIYE